MRIGMILDNTFPPDPRVENEADILRKEGHQVYLFCLQYDDQLPEQEDFQGIKVYRQQVPKWMYSLSALAYTVPFYHWYFQPIIAGFIRDTGVQALHIHDLQIARSVFAANRHFQLPVVLDLHENRPEIMKHYAHVNTLSGKLLISPAVWKKYESRYIQKADRVIVVTKEAKAHYLKELEVAEQKIYVVPNSVRPEFYQDYIIDKAITERYRDYFTLLYIGDTGLRRGIKTMLQSLEYLLPVIPNIKILILGKSKTDQQLKDLVRDAGWQDYVDFEGWQDPRTFPSYLQASDLGICPLHRNLHHDTTYANKLFQYLSFGKPVVVSDCIAQQNLVEKYDCGLVFKDRSVQNFADQVIELYRDRVKYQRFSQNAKEAIETKLNWNVFARQLVQLYETL